MQTEIAKAMGYADRPGRLDVERFMKKYYLVAKEVGDLTRIFAAALEERHKKKQPLAAIRARLKRPKTIDGFESEGGQIGRTSCRESVCQYGLISVETVH